MKYMIVEKFKAGQKPLVFERLQENGRNAVLGEVVAAAANKSWNEFVEEKLFN